jgi:predicted Rossmann-fold nucleotide-binding protein
VLVDSYFYAPLVEFIKEMLLKQGTISKEDLDLLTMVDSVDEIGRLI